MRRSTIAFALVVTAALAAPCAAQKSARADAMKAMEEGKFRLYEDHDAASARRQFNIAVRLDTTFNAPRFNLGVLSEAEGKWDEAIYWFNEFLHHDRTSRFAALARAEVARSKQMLAQGGPTAEDEYLAALELSKRLLVVSNARGSLAEAQRAAKLAPDKWEPYAVASAAALRARDTVAASAFAAQAVQRGAPASITNIVANMYRAGSPDSSIAAAMMADSIARERALEKIRAEARGAATSTPPTQAAPPEVESAARETSASVVVAAYQMRTRSAGARYILSPGFTSNALSKASLFTSGTNARYMPGECGLESSCWRSAASRIFVRHT